ncbi:MAG: hypothetical protein IJU77_11445 [Butyrivibrio sp.]|nr:hypothetical protein [Butyrivibrio sp.]
MGAFIAGTVIGLFVGNVMGFIFAGLMSASSEVDRARERENIVTFKGSEKK